MATLAYCLKKMGKRFDSGTAKRLRDLTSDYRDMDMAKGEAEIQAVQDVLDMLDKEYDSVIDQLHTQMKGQILKIDTTPGRWFNFEFVRNNLPKLKARITELQKMFWDSKAFAKSDVYDGSYPIPVEGGIIAARRTKKYTKDPEYKSKVESAIKGIQENLIGANHTRMVLMGNPDPAGQFGVRYSVEKVSAGYGVNVARAWNNEAKSKYPYTSYLGNVSVREGLQNSMDAVLESLEKGEIKKGVINIKTYVSDDHESTDEEYPVRGRKIDDAKLAETPGTMRTSFEVVDNGVGMSDTDIRDKFLALHGTGKDTIGRFGGFGIAKAVILGPHESSTWSLETRDNRHDGARAQEADQVGTLPEPRQGTAIRVEAAKYIIDDDAQRYVETTVLPKNVSVSYNNKKVKNPFANKKFKEFKDVVNKGKDESDLSMKYYAKAPKGYNRKMIIRLVDKQTGAKLTQGINNIYNDGFPGVLIIDVTTSQTPGGNYYPLTDSRMEMKWDGKQLAEKIIAKYAVDPLSAARTTVDHKWHSLANRSEWKNTVKKTKTDKGYNDLVKTVTDIWNEAQKPIEKLTIEEQLRRPYLNQTIPYTPIEQLNLKVDVGVKGYKGGSMFHAKHLLAFEAVARMYAGAAGGKLETFYPMLSLVVDGGVVEGEYASGSGEMGMNPLSLDKDAAKSPLHYATYLKGLIDHEFTHAFQGAHDEKFSSARETMHKKTAHLFPQTLKIAEAALQMPDKELTRESVVEKEKIKEIVKEIMVPVETILTEYKPLPMRQGKLFDAQTLINEPTGDTPNDIKLYYPSRAKGLPRQLRLFNQRVVGRSPGRVGPTERARDGGSDQLPSPQEIVETGKRDGSFDRADFTRAEAAVAKKARTDALRTLTKGIEYEYWGIPKGSTPDKVLSGDLDIATMKPEQFTANELRGLARLVGTYETGTKAELLERVVNNLDVMDSLEPFTLTDQPVLEMDKKYNLADLQLFAGVLGINPIGKKLEVADRVWRKHLQNRYHSIKGFVQFFEDIKKEIPEDVSEMWLEAQDLFHKAWGDALTVKLPEIAASLNPNFERGVIIHTDELFDALKEIEPKITKLRFDRMVKDRLRQDFILYKVYNHEALSKAQRDSLIVIDGVHYGQIGKKGVSTVNVADLVVKIDSPSLIDAIQSVAERARRRDLSTQLGVLGAEYPSIKKALKKASDKLKLRQAQAAAEADTDTQLSLLEVEAVLSSAGDFIAAFSGEKNSMSKLADQYRDRTAPIKNESIIRQVFYGETPVRISGPIEQYMATRQAKEAYAKRYMRNQGITLDDIKRLFKGTDVIKNADGSVAVTTPNGQQLIIRSVDSVDVDNANFYVNMGRVPVKGETAIGKYAEGKIELHKDLADNWALTHESYHWLEDVGFITSKESDVLRDHIQELHANNRWEPKNIKDVGGAEDRADYVAWSINNRAKQKGLIDRIIQKIKDLIDGFVGMFKLTPQSIVRDIETGKVYQGPKRKSFARKFLGPQYQTTAYHGSPSFFKRFRTRFIGSGEGAQAFGWGLYFSDKKSIAKEYADRLGSDSWANLSWKTPTGTVVLWKNGQSISYGPDQFMSEMRGKARDERHADSMAVVKATLTEDIYIEDHAIHAAYLNTGEAGVVAAIQDIVDNLIAGYEIDIGVNKTEHKRMKAAGKDKGAGLMTRQIQGQQDALNYLKTIRPDSISQMTMEREKTRALYKVMLHKGKDPNEYDWLPWGDSVAEAQAKKIVDQAIDENWLVDDLVDLEETLGFAEGYEPSTGQESYGLIGDTLLMQDEPGPFRQSFDQYEKANKKASLFLLRAGIDGVKFPSGTLSGVEDSPHFNYTVFDENAVDIEAVEQYTTATPQDQEFMREHGNSAAAENVSRSLRDHAMTGWGKIGRWMSRMKEVGIGEFEDTTAWERLLFTPIHYFSKVPAAGAMVEDATQRSDNYYKGLNFIEKDQNGKSRIRIGRKLQKTNKKEYRAINKYLDDNDMNKYGYTVKMKEGIEESSGKTFEIKDPEGKVVGTANSYDDGWAEATRLEVAKLAEQGYSELAQDWVQGTREMSHNVFNIMRGALNDLIKRYNAKGLDLPSVATWVDGARVEVDLKVALAKMGQMRGYYMPRIRKPGRFSMYARPKKGYEDKFHPILKHFETKSFAAAEASRKVYENYIVDIEKINKMPEDVFKIAGQVVAFQEMMNKALEQVSGEMKKGVAADVMAELEKAQLKMGQQLAEGVANIFKGRGVRAHMIMRNDATGTGVWKGYEEDSVQRMAKYVRGVAAGEAKKKMMLDMLRHMTGTDISWQEYRAEHTRAGLEATYKDYLEFVKNRRIDPIKQRNAFHDALTYMEDMGRNDEAVDRMIGMVKGLAVLKYLGGRVSAPLVNLTALATSVPAAMRGFAKIPMHKVPGLLSRSMKGYLEYWRAGRSGRDPNMPGWMNDLFEEIEDNGWHTAQYNKEALSVLKSKIGNNYDTMLETLMMGFGVTEQINRVATIAGAYIGQREANQKTWDAAGADERKVLHKQWLETAKESSDKAHGVYSKANRPHYARGANPMARLAQMFYVFKTFSHNYLQTMYDLGFKTKDRTALLYMALSPAILGGAAASPLIKVMMEAFGLLPGAPDEPEEAMYNWLEANWGETMEQIVRLGAFGLGGHGVSLKGSLEIGITDIPTSLKDLAGAPGSLVSDVVVGGKSILRGDWAKGIERMSPNFIGSGIKAYRESTQGVTTNSNAPLFYGREVVKLDWTETMFRGLSFNPARIAKIRERQWKERKVEQNMAGLRHDIYARIKAFYNQPKVKRSKVRYLDILEEIRTYNTLVQRSGKPFPVITHKSIKNNLRRAFRPSKRERLRRTD